MSIGSLAVHHCERMFPVMRFFASLFLFGLLAPWLHELEADGA